MARYMDIPSSTMATVVGTRNTVNTVATALAHTEDIVRSMDGMEVIRRTGMVVIRRTGMEVPHTEGMEVSYTEGMEVSRMAGTGMRRRTRCTTLSIRNIRSTVAQGGWRLRVCTCNFPSTSHGTDMILRWWRVTRWSIVGVGAERCV
jgi:hypothetical protein